MIKKTLSILVIILLLGKNFSYAEEKIKILVKTNSGFTRIMFLANESIEFNPKLENHILNVKFEKTVLIDNKNLKISNSVIKNIDIINDHEIKFTLGNNYKVRKFIGDKSFGVDLLKTLDKEEKNITKDTKSSPLENSIEKDSESLKNNIKNKEHIDQSNDISTQDKTNEITQFPIIEKSEDEFLIYEQKNNNNIRDIIFKWKKDVAASIFVRSNYLWIIFNQKENFKFDNIINKIPEFSSIEQIENSEYSIIKIDLIKTPDISAYKKGKDWIVSLSNHSSENYNIKKNIIKEYTTIYSEGIFFPAENLDSKPLIINDPVMGDRLIIVPFLQSVYFVDKMKHYLDFILLPSHQGFVIAPLNNSVRLEIIPPGIEIISKKSQIEIPKLSINDSSIFPFNKNNASEKYLEAKKNITSFAPENNRNNCNSKINLIKFYINNELNYEAIGFLKLIDENECINQKKDILILKSVANYLVNRNKEAKKSFDELDSQEFTEQQKLEIDFWNNANDIKLSKQSDLNYLSYKDKFLSIYPDKIRQDFALLDLENSMSKNNINYVGDILKDLSSDNLTLHNKNLANYYKGLYLEKNSNNDQAIEIWKDLTNEIEDRKVRALSGFAIIKNQFNNNKIDINTAIEGLNKLRNIWRDGNLELDILKLLADLYNKDKNYIETLRTWKLIASNFSNSNDSLFVTVQMSQLFNKIFSGEIENGLTDFQSVSLFYEFRELTPLGKIGDEIVTNLVNKLIKLDLFEKAQELLDHQIKYRLNDECKYTEINKLAFVYILDNKPDKALELYGESDLSIFPDNEKYKAKLLRAKSYIDLKKYDEALLLLNKDNNEDAEELLLQIYFNNDNWNKAIKILESYILEPEYNSKKLTEKDKDNILKLAIAYYMNHQNNLVNDLSIQLKDKIKNDKLETALSFLSKNPTQIDYTNLKLDLGLNNIDSFLNNYKNTVVN